MSALRSIAAVVVGSALPLLKYLSCTFRCGSRSSSAATRLEARISRSIAAAVVGSALLTLPGCPEEVGEPPPADAGVCMTDDDCNDDVSCGALRTCVHSVCSVEATRYIPCPLP